MTGLRVIENSESRRYIDLCRKHHDKVYIDDETLNPTDIKFLENMRKKLKDSYTPKSLKRTGILSYISNIFCMNDVIERENHEEKLGEEYRNLGLELKMDCSLNSSKKNQIMARRKEICTALYPEYHPT